MTTLRVWAPLPGSVEVETGGTRTPLTPLDDGWWTGEIGGPGTDYALVLDGGDPRPDPRSAWQPHGVHGPSRVVDHDAFAWTDQHWRGVPLPGSVLYEMHVGTFTPEGTFDAAIARLDHLVDLGVSAVELLPCNAFAGERGWGYDGVAWYAVHDPYGGPEGLKRLVDACHARGLGVVMDVVYNHLGPAGNYLPEFGPYLTEAHTTPWGPAVNLDQAGSDHVRRFILDSALAWLRDYHVDGLRVDAVHAFVDERATHLLEEMSTEVEALGAQLRKPLFLIAESDLNDARMVTSRAAGGHGFDGQWADDVHHALHANLAREASGYYGDFAGLPILAKVMSKVFLHDGTFSTFRGRTHGRPVPSTVPGHPFVVYLQDHDQVGNRAVGDRVSATVSDGLLKVGAALVLTSPYTPMLWMGEEWGARTPWQFFSDHEGALGDAVREGRRAEFGSHGWDSEDVPDPQSEQTFLDSKLDWSELDQPRHAELRDWTRALIALRRSRLELSDGRRELVDVSYDEQAQWMVVRRGPVAVACNLGTAPAQVPVPGGAARVVLASTPLDAVAPGQLTLAGESVAVVDLAL
ncbi:MAG: GH13_10 / GH13 / GH13_9 / GH13_36 / GH13_11 [uncultured Frankineae bacterium]|uniref:Malto-oligosyltrehalose trehalohydrolase n=1 Tax=uncultured Frankineae bacterium TaxID=437475 RepID=A0A6J4L0K3_9ACTN|nr:MAG: GH13_10 / GH13 / GH13_9 / GH13_36 / GH13_11 [uncultured Frankineae bacterium]